MKKKVGATRCSMTGKACRHCSQEVRRTSQMVGVIKTGLMERREVSVKMGEFCNNDGRTFVRDITKCPADVALGIPLVPYKITELQWMSLRENT